MSDYKHYLLRQMGIKEGSIPPSEVETDEFDNIDPQQDPNQKEPTPGERMMSPTAIAMPVLGMAIRGSSTGGLPTGADRKMTAPGKLGGYEPVQAAKQNSELIDKTPSNSTINASSPIADDSSVTQADGTSHPHQTQNSSGAAPQDVTGASTDSDPSLTLKSATPQGIEIDVNEDDKDPGVEKQKPMNKEEEPKDEEPIELQIGALEEDDSSKISFRSLAEGKHKSGCKCGFCMNKTRFGKSKKDKSDDDGSENKDKETYGKKDKKDKEVPTEKLDEIRKSLQEKAASGKMNSKESELFSTITEVLRKRGHGLEEKLFSKKTMLETARIEKN